MQANLAKELSSKDVLLLALPEESFWEDAMSANQSLSESFQEICYVTLTKMVQDIVRSMEEHDINYNKYEFVDACTESVSSKFLGSTQAIYVDAPNALTEILLAISKSLNAHPKTELVFFDSLSVLSIYHEPKTIMKFVHSLVNTCRVKKKKLLLSILESDLSKETTKGFEPFVDGVIHFRGKK